MVPIKGDNMFGDDRVVLLASLISRFKLNLREIIENEIRIHATKPNTSYPFPCLITQLCKESYSPILTDIDVKTTIRKSHIFERSNNEEKLRL